LLEECINNHRVGKIIVYDKNVVIDESLVNIARKPSTNNAEIINKDKNKHTGVDFVVRQLLINDDEVCVVGDEENDKDMLMGYINSFIINHQYNEHLSISKYRIDNMLELKKYINDD